MKDLTNNDIINLYYDWMEEVFDRFKVKDDYRQEMYLMLLETDNQKLVDLHNADKLKFWLIRFIKNNVFSKTSRCYYKYAKYYEVFRPLSECED